MSKSTARKCAVCGGPFVIRKRVGGGNVIMVGGAWVNAGTIVPVCQTHADMIDAARAVARIGGHAARQAAERVIMSADADTQDATAARAPRLDALKRAAWQIIDNGEIMSALQRHARTAASRSGQLVTAAHEAAWDEVTEAFVVRVARAAFATVADDVDAVEAVRSVDWATLLRGMGHVNVTRTGFYQGKLTTSHSASAVRSAAAADGGWDELALADTIADREMTPEERVALLALAREHADMPGEVGAAAREVLQAYAG